MHSVTKSEMVVSGVVSTSVSLTLLTCGRGQVTLPVFYQHRFWVDRNSLLWRLRGQHSNMKGLFFFFLSTNAEGRGLGFVLVLWVFRRMPLSQASLRYLLYLLSATLEYLPCLISMEWPETHFQVSRFWQWSSSFRSFTTQCTQGYKHCSVLILGQKTAGRNLSSSEVLCGLQARGCVQGEGQVYRHQSFPTPNTANLDPEVCHLGKDRLKWSQVFLPPSPFKSIWFSLYTLSCKLHTLKFNIYMYN